MRTDGSRGLLFDHFDDETQAYAKLYTILAAAAVSGIPYHSGHILRSDGILMEGRVFDRRVDEPEEPVEPEFTLGDVNDDGNVNISDVTTLIDYMLDNDTPLNLAAADVTKDGSVNIADVTTLIDYLLSGSWPLP